MFERIGDIELDQKLRHQEREWRIQLYGWALMLAIVVAALLGVFGTGPLSSATAGSEPAGLTVKYERFIRHQGEMELTIQIAPGQVESGQVELWIDHAYLDDMVIEDVQPEPEEVRTSGDQRIYVFAVDSADAVLNVHIDSTPKAMGRLESKMGVNEGSGITFTQISLP
jgi:hypothetical protein